MVGTLESRCGRAIAAAVLGAALAVPAYAQTGQVKGRVVDAKNQPIEGAVVTIAQSDAARNSKFELKTDKKGTFLQIGITPGDYKITAATKDGLTQTVTVHIGLDVKEVNFSLRPGGGGGEMSKEEAAKNAAKVAAIQAKFKEGAALTEQGKFDEAIVKFNEVLVDVPKCPECYVNIGSAYSGKKEYDKAEEAFKKAIELAPTSPDPYNELASIYNAQKKFKEAQEMSAEAGKRAAAVPGGMSANALYNQGVIAWNGSDFAKAQEAFTGAITADANHGEAHFMLGRVYLNQGKLAEAAKEFETYVKVAPNGPNAKEAQTNREMLKQYIK